MSPSWSLSQRFEPPLSLLPWPTKRPSPSEKLLTALPELRSKMKLSQTVSVADPRVPLSWRSAFLMSLPEVRPMWLPSTARGVPSESV
jgi:hypothetical protein